MWLGSPAAPDERATEGHIPASHLADLAAICHVSSAMKSRSSRRILVLLLGVFLTLGMSLSAVQAGNLTAKMAMASDMDVTGQGGCTACGDGGGTESSPNCMPTCTASGLALLTGGAIAIAARTSGPPAVAVRLPHGRTFSPEPYPPRAADPM